MLIFKSATYWMFVSYGICFADRINFTQINFLFTHTCAAIFALLKKLRSGGSTEMKLPLTAWIADKSQTWP